MLTRVMCNIIVDFYVNMGRDIDTVDRFHKSQINIHSRKMNQRLFKINFDL